MLNAFMERQSLEAGDVTPAADAERLQFDAETLRGEEKIPFFFLHDIIPTIEKLHLVRLKTLPIRRCILSCVGSDIIILWDNLVGSRENKSK